MFVGVAIDVTLLRALVLLPFLLRRSILMVNVLGAVVGGCYDRSVYRNITRGKTPLTSLALASTSLLGGLGRSAVIFHDFLEKLAQVCPCALRVGEAGEGGELLLVELCH